MIEAAIPNSAYIGDTIRITGRNFSTDPSKMEVSFTGSLARIISASPTELVVKVPYEANSSDGILYVTVNGKEASSDFGFNVLKPDFTFSYMNPKDGSAGQIVRIHGTKIPEDPAKVKVWLDETIPAEVLHSEASYLDVLVPYGASSGTFLVEIGGRLALSPGFFTYHQGGKWERIGEFPNGNVVSGQTGFVLGDKIYVGLGSTYFDGSKEFYEMDPVTYQLSRKNDFPGLSRNSSYSFTYGGKGYMVNGHQGSDKYTNEFWKYDPATDNWQQLADFPGTARAFGVTFLVGDKAYIGLGYDHSTYYKEFWSYDLITSTWTRLEDFPGDGRNGAGFFMIDGKGYVFGGRSSGGLLNDLWVFDPANQSWTRKADASIITNRANVMSFVLNGKGYIAGGWDANGDRSVRGTFRYDPATDSWERRSNFYDYENSYSLGLTYQNKAFTFAGNYNSKYHVFTDQD